MSGYDPSGTSAQQWIYITSFSSLIAASFAIVFVAEPIKNMTFLGWETGVCMTSSISILLSLIGIYAAYASRSGRTTSFYYWHWYGIFSFYQLFALLYLSLHTIISQPLAFTEIKKHCVAMCQHLIFRVFSFKKKYYGFVARYHIEPLIKSLALVILPLKQFSVVFPCRGRRDPSRMVRPNDPVATREIDPQFTVLTRAWFTYIEKSPVLDRRTVKCTGSFIGMGGEHRSGR
jgi:hypothetical protein